MEMAFQHGRRGRLSTAKVNRNNSLVKGARKFEQDTSACVNESLIERVPPLHYSDG